MGLNFGGAIIEKKGKNPKEIAELVFDAELEIVEGCSNVGVLSDPKNEDQLFVIELNDFVLINCYANTVYTDGLHFDRLRDSENQCLRYMFSETAMSFGFEFNNFMFKNKKHGGYVFMALERMEFILLVMMFLVFRKRKMLI